MPIKRKQDGNPVVLSQAEASKYLNRKVEKKFPGFGLFKGTVLRYDAAAGLFKVEYEDGDGEELWLDELEPILISSKSSNVKKRDSDGKLIKAKKEAVAAEQEEEEEEEYFWIVKEMTYPSSRHMSESDVDAMTEVREVARFKSKAAAIKGAKEARDRNCSFEDWAEDYFGNAEPPYNSIYGDNYDDDEYVNIYLVSPEAQKEKAKKEKAKLAKLLKSTKPTPKNVAASSSSSSSKGKTPSSWRVYFGEDPMGTKPSFDQGLFYRNACVITTGKVVSPDKYPKNMLYRMQAISDRNYLMRQFCLEGANVTGARYVTEKQRNVICRVVTWLTPCNLNDFAGDPSIVDTVHASLLLPSDKYCGAQLTADALVSACSPATKSLFMNCYQPSGRGYKCPGYSDTAIPDAIAATKGSLQCIGLNEATLSSMVGEALLSCTDLRGIMFAQCNDVHSSPLTDEIFAQVLRQCGSKLEWLYIGKGEHFGEQCFQALVDGCCPVLKLLYVGETEYGVPHASSDLIRRAVGAGSTLATNSLKFLSIYPDIKEKSMIELGQAKDKLDKKTTF